MTRALGMPWQPADQALRPSLNISAAPTASTRLVIGYRVLPAWTTITRLRHNRTGEQLLDHEPFPTRAQLGVAQQAAGQVGTIPGLAVVVGDHGPEPTHGGSRIRTPRLARSRSRNVRT